MRQSTIRKRIWFVFMTTAVADPRPGKQWGYKRRTVTTCQEICRARDGSCLYHASHFPQSGDRTVAGKNMWAADFGNVVHHVPAMYTDAQTATWFENRIVVKHSGRCVS
jgi:hypothetical protein